jgi:hypothetical protein
MSIADDIKRWQRGGRGFPVVFHMDAANALDRLQRYGTLLDGEGLPDTLKPEDINQPLAKAVYDLTKERHHKKERAWIPPSNALHILP